MSLDLGTRTGLVPNTYRSPRRRDTARAMSEQNVQVVRALFAAWAERNSAAAMRRVDPEVEFDFSAIAALGDEFGGGQTAVALQDRLASWFRIFESLEFCPEQFVDLGDHVIVLLTALRSRGVRRPLTRLPMETWDGSRILNSALSFESHAGLTPD
jgi:ketosteroid isomerase-like protein